MTPQQEKILQYYAAEVMRNSKFLHLTSAPSAEEFWDRHIKDALELDQLAIASPVQAGQRVLDVGSGNGIPGIPFAVIHPDWQVELLDSNNKKCGFLDTFIKSYKIRNVAVLCGRAEDLALESRRESYDFVIARALSKLPVAIELTGAFVKVGGCLLVPHSKSSGEELHKSKRALTEMGLSLQSKQMYRLKNLEGVALVFMKNHQTPSQYPRRSGIPEKRPL